MRGRVLMWGGAVVAVTALAGLGVYFARVGLEQADQLASVIGVFVAVVGLGVAVYGLVADRRARTIRQQADATRDSQVYHAGRDINNRPTGQPALATPDGEGTEGQKQLGVRQQAKATERSRIYQAGRDINKR